ncbi:hypothetical protein GGR51DRAFT_512388, partial [Nemania sp. FL0031]
MNVQMPDPSGYLGILHVYTLPTCGVCSFPASGGHTLNQVVIWLHLSSTMALYLRCTYTVWYLYFLV